MARLPGEHGTRSQGHWGSKVINSLALMVLGSGLTVACDRLVTRVAPSVAEGDRVAQTQTGQRTLGIGPLGEKSFVATAIERVGPAVVRINASRTVQTNVPDIFRRFELDVPSERQEQGTGSGFIFDTKGLILTNAHVVEGADQVRVTLKDGRTLEGKVLGQDSLTDVAVIQVDGGDLPVVTLGNSDNLEPGEWAIAIGNPLGLDNTVTLGIISATGRSSGEIGVADKRVSFIQTDAAINPGNSGGPLLNAQGEVIGMNTAIIGNAQGLGFAIPIKTAQKIADQLVNQGKADHPYLGVRMVTVTPELKRQINQDPNATIKINVDQGVLVVEVVQGSPAAQAGVRAGDIITGLGGQKITRADEVQRVVEGTEIGQSLVMEVERNGQTVKLQVRPGAYPTESGQ